MTVDRTPQTLVTGASGLVGNNLVRHLLELGRPVRVLVRQPDNPSLQGLDVETALGDVLHPLSLQSAMAGVRSVFHLAAEISIDGRQTIPMREVNVLGTANVADACLRSGVQRMVHVSSIHAFSYLPNSRPIDESRGLALDVKKHLPYDVSKAEGELEIRSAIKKGLNAVILNPVGIFGPHDYGPSPGGEFLRQLIHRKLPGLVRAGYYWVDVRDVAQAAVAAELEGRSGENYILHGHYATFPSIARWVQETCGSRPPSISVPIWVARIAAPLAVRYSRWLGLRPLVTPEAIRIVQCHQHIETDKAALELGFRARPLRDTIGDAVRWLQDRDASGRGQQSG